MINTSTILRFFDPRGRLGRLAYIKSLFLRALIVVTIKVALSALGYLLFGTEFKIPIPSEEIPESTLAVLNNPPSLLAILFYLPIQIRRLRDANISPVWLAPIYLCFVLPWTLLTDLPNLALIALLSFSLYNFGISFIELLKPGHTYKEWVRSKDQPA